MECHFCELEIATGQVQHSYMCQKCGHVYITVVASEDIAGENFKSDEKKIISISIRNDYEKRGRKKYSEPLTLKNLRQIVNQYRPLYPLDKMDNALLNIEKTSSYVAKAITIKIENDYPYYHCFNQKELHSILILLHQEDFINAPDEKNPHKCFVAMWLTPEMDNIYEKAIKPAIEFIEEGETEPRFHAVKIDNVEHVNDINDEIIAAIRRSRFMVCDLTGYRGGVYFEAGFAYGLGLDVIYTCSKDWTKPEILKKLRWRRN